MVDIALNPRWGCVVRPVKELKGFQTIMMKKGGNQTGYFHPHSERFKIL